jgi:hypothetical protein
MPGGEQRQFDGQLNDDYSIEVLVYRKSLFSLHENRHNFPLVTYFPASLIPLLLLVVYCLMMKTRRIL